MKTVLSYLLTPVFFLFFGLTLVVFQPVQVIARSVFGPSAHDKTVSALNYCLMRCLMILGTHLYFSGFRSLPADKPVLVISNHQSMWDIPPVIWKIRKNHPKYIAKASLARFIPSISYNLKYGGSVPIDRNDTEGSIKKIEGLAQFVKQHNFAICIYPEGTRSRNGEIKPFKSTGIDAILRIVPEILVVPIAIKNTGLIDNDGKFTKSIGVKAVFTMLPGRYLSRETLESDLESIRQEIIKTIA